MYFGVTPVLILFLPLKLLTGVAISESVTSVLFAWAGFIAVVWLLWKIRWRYFSRGSSFWMLAGVIALGLATMMPDLLRRPSVWEVPITGAYLCAMLGLFCLYRSLLHRRSFVWLAAASFWLGLAVGSRPVYLFACAA